MVLFRKAFKTLSARRSFHGCEIPPFFTIGCVCNNPNGGISNFGTLIIKGFGFYTLVTTVVQIPYGVIIAVSILLCVYLYDYFSCSGRQTRCRMTIVFLCSNITRAFGWRFLSDSNQAGRLICFYLTGPFNTAFVPTLSPTTANTAGPTQKVATNAVRFLGYCTGNIAGPFCYLTSQAPQYALRIQRLIVSPFLEVCIVLLLKILLSRENTRQVRIQRVIEGRSDGRDHDATAFSDMTGRENMNLNTHIDGTMG